MDGIVTKRDLLPGDRPGQGQLILTGKDISVAMEKEVKQTEHPGQDETVIAAKIAASYPQYGLTLKITPPQVVDPPIPIDRTPQQNCSDWGYLQKMARRHGYVTYVEPGPVPFMNRLYWGPPGILGLPQKTLSVNLGPETNVSNISFGHDALATTVVQGFVKDRLTGKTIPVLAMVPSRPPLGLVPENLTQFGKQRRIPILTSGLNMAQASARAQAVLDRSTDDTISASGTLDSLKYNTVLRARAPVDLRGAGASFSGSYLVRSVTHNISQGNYTQDFALSRNEIGPKSPNVRVN
jgi:phage protein D